MCRLGAILLLAVVLLGAGRARAEVVDSGAGGFLVRGEATVQSAPDAVYEALTKDIGGWWDSEHTFSRDSRNLSLDARPGGCFCERLPDGGGVRHMTVVFASPGKRLRLTGGLGPLQALGVAGSMTWSLAESEGGTMVGLTYSVGGYFEGGLQGMAPAVDSVLQVQLTRLKRYVETGDPRSE
jgi:uncharacterized protein YndB with AHSA1/START domain